MAFSTARQPTFLDDVEPPDLGLPVKFKQFRQGQREGTEFALYGPKGDGGKRFKLLGAPGGIGKTLMAETVSVLSGEGSRSVTLSSTNTLLDQRQNDGFERMRDIRGRNNYDCVDTWSDGKAHNCEYGSEHGCGKYGTQKCEYSHDQDKANLAASISTNYQYWMRVNAHNPNSLREGGAIDTLILDEGHLAPEELCTFLNTWVSTDHLTEFANDPNTGRPIRAPWKLERDMNGMVDKYWHTYVDTVKTNAHNALTDIVAANEYKSEREALNDPEYRRVQKIEDSVKNVVRHGLDDNWIWNLTAKGVSFKAIWGGKYAEMYLFQHIPKVIILSATSRPKLANLLRIKQSEMDYREWPRQFPRRNGPVYVMDVCGMGRKTPEVDKLRMVEAVDELIRSRPGKKILIHTHSYDRAKWLKANSEFGWAFITNDPVKPQRQTDQEMLPDTAYLEKLSANQAADKYRAAKCTKDNPVILAGPSFGTGWDFPGDQCEVIVIIKVPFPDMSDPVIKARSTQDRNYVNYTAFQGLAQQSMRGNRFDADLCEIYIFDEIFWNFSKYARDHAPRCFEVTQYIKIGSDGNIRGKLPKALPKMVMKVEPEMVEAEAGD